MSVALQKGMTLAEFLDWEERQELRYEFDGFQPVAMTGGTLRHEAIGGTLRALLHDAPAWQSVSPLGPEQQDRSARTHSLSGCVR